MKLGAKKKKVKDETQSLVKSGFKICNETGSQDKAVDVQTRRQLE